MDIQNRPMLKRCAAERLLAASCNPKKQILIHTGALLLISLVLTVVDFLLNNAIAETGGLSGLGMRSLFSTVQSCLRLAQIILLPFWQLGYTYVTLKFARREATSPADLCAGFRIFFPMLRLQLWKTLLYLLIGLFSGQLGSFLFMLTPWSRPLLEAFSSVMSSNDATAVYAAMESVLPEIIVPLLLCYGVAFLAVAAPFYYHFRLAEYSLLDAPEKGAISAMRNSWHIMRGNVTALIKLDFSFWWFIILDLLVSVIAYADVILQALGVALPVSAEVAFWGTFLLYLVSQLVLYCWRKNEVCTTYALFYDALCPVPAEPNE